MIPSLLLHSMATPELDAAGCLNVAAEFGLDGIELIVDEGYPSALRPDLIPRVIDHLAAHATAEGLAIGAVSSYARDIGDLDQRRRQDATSLLRQAIDIAHGLSAPAVRVLAGSRELDGIEWDDAASRFVEGLRPLLDDAAAAGVRLELENHMDTLATSARLTAELAARLDHPAISIIYDPPNLALMTAETPSIAIAVQAPWLRRVHAKNFVRDGQDRRAVDLETGVVDWPEVTTALAAQDIHVESMTFEYERRWFDDLPPATVALPPQIAFLRSLLRVKEGADS